LGSRDSAIAAFSAPTSHIVQQPTGKKKEKYIRAFAFPLKSSVETIDNTLAEETSSTDRFTRHNLNSDGQLISTRAVIVLGPLLDLVKALMISGLYKTQIFFLQILLIYIQQTSVYFRSMTSGAMHKVNYPYLELRLRFRWNGHQKTLGRSPVCSNRSDDISKHGCDPFQIHQFSTEDLKSSFINLYCDKS
jgi:hypothetical protein